MRPAPSATPTVTVSEPGLSKAEQTRRTRALIIDTGIRCIAKYGYTQTSMHLIAKEANISRGPMHYHFTDKNDLMAAIAERLPGQISPETIRRLQRAKTLAERLETLVDISLEQHLGDHHMVAIDLLAAARRDTALAAAVLPHFANSEGRVDAWFFDFAQDLKWPETRMRAFRTVFVAGLRGLALDPANKTNTAQHKAAAKLFKDMLLTYLKT